MIGRKTVTLADSDMRGAPGEVGSRQSSLYRGSAAFPSTHAVHDTPTRVFLDVTPDPLTPRHWLAM
jgi:hypothetical protein